MTAQLHRVRLVWLLVGVFAAMVGAHDAFQASAGYQLLGIVLLILGAASCLAMVPALASSPWIVLASMTSTLLIALTLAIGSVLNFTSPMTQNLRLLLWILVLAVVVWSVVKAVRQLLRERLTLPPMQPLAIASTIGGAGTLIVAVGGFVYSTQLAPLAATPSFAVQGELREVGRRDHLIAVSGNIKIHNSSDTSVQVLSSLYRVEAFRFTGRKFDPQQEWFSQQEQQAAQAYLADRPERASVDYANPPVLVQAGRIVPQAWVFDKGEDYNRTFVAYLPDDYDLAQLTVEIAGARDTVLELDTRHYRPFADDHPWESGAEMGVVEASWFQRATQPPRLVADRWNFGDPAVASWADPTYPTIDPCVFFDQSPVCGAGSVKFLGIINTSTQFELWLKPAGSTP